MPETQVQGGTPGKPEMMDVVVPETQQDSEESKGNGAPESDKPAAFVPETQLPTSTSREASGKEHPAPPPPPHPRLKTVSL